MIVVDTSVWVDFFRGSDTKACRSLAMLLQDRANLATTEVVVIELLAGARADELEAVRARLAAFPVIPLQGLSDFEEAAELFRLCRAGGETVRELSDCLIAVPAIRAGVPVLHADSDFDKLARHTELEVLTLAA